MTLCRVMYTKLSFSEEMTKMIDETWAVDVVYMNVSKTCKTRSGMVGWSRKLRHIGSWFDWSQNWLTHRREWVVVEGCYSVWRPVNSGFCKNHCWDFCICKAILDEILSGLTQNYRWHKICQSCGWCGRLWKVSAIYGPVGNVGGKMADGIRLTKCEMLHSEGQM